MVNQTQQITEIQAIVIEAGSHTFKIGYAGEDTPKASFTSRVGVVGDKLYFAEDSYLFRPGMEIVKPIVAGVVQNWDLYEQLWRFAFKKMRINPQEFPLMIVEPSDQSSEQRQKIAELAFEKFGVAGVYFGRAGVLAAFAAGRSTALVVDVGGDTTTVTPVYEGYQLKKGVMSQAMGGNVVDQFILQSLAEEKNIEFTPKFLIAKKKRVDVNKPAEIQTKQLQIVTESFKLTEQLRVAEDFKHCVGEVTEAKYNDGQIGLRPQTSYEFPDGFNSNFGAERFRYCEVLFCPNQEQSESENSQLQNLASLVYTSLSNCDQDVRPQLLGHVVVTGGSTLIGQFPERLQHELSLLIPALRIKMFSFGNSVERRFGSWIGGSILASLGTFQQLWVSKQEFEEGGAGLLEKRCP